jgi:hypothetical protein
MYGLFESLKSFSVPKGTQERYEKDTALSTEEILILTGTSDTAWNY